MAATAAALGLSLVHLGSFNGEAYLINPKSSHNSPSFKQSTRNLFLRGCRPYLLMRKRRRCNNHVGLVTTISPVMEWQDCSSSIEVDVPCSVAYECYSDRESIPKWMAFISSVKVLEDKPDLSRWSMKYHAFGQDLEFSWLARNMQPIPNQKIHWRSLEGLPNRGAVQFYPKGSSSCRIEASKPLFEYSLSCGLERFANGSVRFFPKGPSSCKVELTISYEVPQILVPVTAALRPFMEMLLSRGLESFAEYAKETYGKKASQSRR